MTSQRYSLLTLSLPANPRWISAAPLVCVMSCSSQAAPGLLGVCAACPQLQLPLLFFPVALSCTVFQLPEPSLLAGWTASMAWGALSSERHLFGIFCSPQCDESEMKSSFYSSVNGCTWFVAMMHIPGGQAVTLPDFFLIRTACLPEGIVCFC